MSNKHYLNTLCALYSLDTPIYTASKRNHPETKQLEHMTIVSVRYPSYTEHINSPAMVLESDWFHTKKESELDVATKMINTLKRTFDPKKLVEYNDYLPEMYNWYSGSRTAATTKIHIVDLDHKPTMLNTIVNCRDPSVYYVTTLSKYSTDDYREMEVRKHSTLNTFKSVQSNIIETNYIFIAGQVASQINTLNAPKPSVVITAPKKFSGAIKSMFLSQGIQCVIQQ